jgi:hypothetical protein
MFVKQVFKLILFALLVIFSNKSISQTGRKVDINVNENKGTFVVRSISRNKQINKDSSELEVRFFQSFCNLLKPGPYPFRFFAIDTTTFSTESGGTLKLKLKRGWHKISLDLKNSPPFTGFKEVLLKFKKRNRYIIDIYFPQPFPLLHH